jgi:uncharacterized heparinase superfamily protein
MLQLASLLFKDEAINITSNKYQSSYEVFGNKSVQELSNTKQNAFESHYYDKGGFVSIKDQQSYFITDVGEVGMKGRGGHGHNDLFSFELMHNQTDLIVDPGCYTYTGDLALKTKMKSSTYHNGLLVDGKEIAPMIGNWGISNVALPYNVEVNKTAKGVTISGMHSGYNRFQDSVVHERNFEILKEGFELSCTDRIFCKDAHQITRNLHFSEKVSLEIKDKDILVSCNAKYYKIVVDVNTECRIENFNLSYNYGSKINSKKLVLLSTIKGTSKLFFSIKKNYINE